MTTVYVYEEDVLAELISENAHFGKVKFTSKDGIAFEVEIPCEDYSYV